VDLLALLDRLEREFFSRLDKKTGWGKNEVKKEFGEALRNVIVVTYPRVIADAAAEAGKAVAANESKQTNKDKDYCSSPDKDKDYCMSCLLDCRFYHPENTGR
jgi:hypothetical protein